MKSPQDTPIGEWKVALEKWWLTLNPHNHNPQLIWKADITVLISRILLSQKEQHEKQLQAAREEAEKLTEAVHMYNTDRTAAIEAIRTEERSRIVKLIEERFQSNGATPDSADKKGQIPISDEQMLKGWKCALYDILNALKGNLSDNSK